MLKKLTVICYAALILSGIAGCSKTNPLANKAGMENLVYMLRAENDQDWPRVCELYYINTGALRYQRHQGMCIEKSANLYNKYKNHEALAGATLADFRDSKVWEMVNAQYPNRSFR